MISSIFDTRVITLDFDTAVKDLSKFKIGTVKIEGLEKQLRLIVKDTTWKFSESWLFIRDNVEIDKMIEDLRLIVEFLNDNNISWESGAVKIRDNEDRIGFFKITDTLASILLMDEEGLIEKQEFELPVKKDKL